MKSNVIDIRTKQPIPIDKPRKTLPAGIFMGACNLIDGLSHDMTRRHLLDALRESMLSLNVPPKDLRALVFIFDSKNSKMFFVEHMKEAAGNIFDGQFMFD